MIIVACPLRADIAFVLDSSASINLANPNNWNIMLDFVVNMIRRLTVSSTDMRVAALTFSDDAQIAFHLDAYFHKIPLIAAVRSIPYLNARTNTAAGLHAMRTQLFDPSNRGQRGDRRNATNIAILVTDGGSNVNNQSTIPFANLAKQAGITVLAVGISSAVNVAELIGISSTGVEGETFWRTPNFQVTLREIDNIINGTCQADVPGLYFSWKIKMSTFYKCNTETYTCNTRIHIGFGV